MISRLELQDVNSTTVLERINAQAVDMGIEDGFDSSDLNILIDLLGQTVSDDEYVETETRYPSPPPGTLAMMVPNTYYHINVKLTSLWIAALILDATKTLGAVSLLLAWKGLPTQAFASLSPSSGEYCNFLFAAKVDRSKGAVNAKTIVDLISGRQCPYTKSGCRYIRDDVCAINETKVETNLQNLIDKGSLVKRGEILAVPL